MTLTLSSLPEEILLLIYERLDIPSLEFLSQTNKYFRSLAIEHGWMTYVREHPRPSDSLSRARGKWADSTRVRYDAMADIAWSQTNFIARPLCRMWPKKLHPVIAINPSRLVVAAGSTLYSYSFSDSLDVTSPKISLEGSVSLLDDPESPRNITAISFLPDGGEDRTLLVTFQDGAIDQIVLNIVPGPWHDSHPASIYVSKTTREVLTKDYIESISAPRDSSTLLTISSYNTATLYRQNPNDPTDFLTVSSLKLGGTTRSWTCLLSPKSSTPYALFGTASSTPLNLHLITESSILPNPSAILHTHKAEERKLTEMSALAVYGIAHGPPCSPWGSSPYIIVSGWYDGQVRCYDLRTPSILSPELPSSTSAPAPALHRPVLSLADRWSFEPIYSISTGGGGGSHIAAGTARHSVVSFWDVRSPSKGWSVHAPGNDPSPVYDVVLESSRFFGVTQSRAFVYDFGPGVTTETYPPIPYVKGGADNLRHKNGTHPATYHVLRYEHNSSGLGIS